MLVAENVHKSFQGVSALNGASLLVEERSITGLIGPNGAGKSTLFAVLSSFQKADHGRVVWRDQDITGMPAHKIVHKGLVRTFQVPREFGELTVLENLQVAPLEQAGEQVWKVWLRWGQVAARERAILEQAEKILAFLKLEHVRNDLAKSLSGGQKKLLELGRALMTEPELLMLDEPFAGVNPVLIEEIMERIRELNQQGRTFFIIEHNIQAISALSDVLYVMAEGTVLARGKPEEVVKDPRVLDAYLGGTA